MITLEKANTIVQTVFDTGATASMNPLCVVVLDAGGHMKACARQDGVPFGRVEVAHGKAFGALSIGVNSRALGELALDRPHFMAGVGTAIGGALVPVPGGVIVVDLVGSPIGSVGVSGDSSDNDELAVLAGIEAAGLSAKA